MEVNSLVSHITEKSIAKLRRQRIMKDDSKPSSRMSLQSGDTHIKIQHHLRKYYENHSPFITPKYTSKKLTKIPEMQSSEYNWIPTRVEDEKYEKIDQILSVSPSDYIKKDKEKKIHENELRHCLKSLTTLLECSVASRMSTTSLAKSISIIRDHLKTANSNENITENDKKATQNNRKTTESLFDMMERSLNQSVKEDGLMKSQEDRSRRYSLEEKFSIYSSPSDTSADMDLDSHSNITEVK